MPRDLDLGNKDLRIVIAVVDAFYPFHNGQGLLYMGEISNMPGHVAVVTRDGTVLWGYHPENFREAEEDEV